MGHWLLCSARSRYTAHVHAESQRVAASVLHAHAVLVNACERLALWQQKDVELSTPYPLWWGLCLAGRVPTILVPMCQNVPPHPVYIHTRRQRLVAKQSVPAGKPAWRISGPGFLLGVVYICISMCWVKAPRCNIDSLRQPVRSQPP